MLPKRNSVLLTGYPRKKHPGMKQPQKVAEDINYAKAQIEKMAKN
jgi:hypothetical protein